MTKEKPYVVYALLPSDLDPTDIIQNNIEELSKYFCYIGMSSKAKTRRATHLRDLKLQRHANSNLQEYYNKAIENNPNFTLNFSILVRDLTREEAIDEEARHIDLFSEMMDCTNIAGGEGKHNTGERNPGYGKPMSEEARAKMREAWKKRVVSEETKLRMAEAKKGEKNSFYGHKHSEESKQAMSKKLKGRVIDDNWKANMSAGRMGGKNGRAAPISAEGIIYDTMTDAGKALGLSRETVKARVISKNFKDYFKVPKA